MTGNLSTTTTTGIARRWRAQQTRRRRNRLDPATGELFVVRWVNHTHIRQNVLHRYFRRGYDAHRFAEKRRRHGDQVALYVTDVAEWRRTVPDERGI